MTTDRHTPTSTDDERDKETAARIREINLLLIDGKCTPKYAYERIEEIVKEQHSGRDYWSKPMTNYNERVDELMPCDCKFLKGFAWRKGDPCEGCINGRLKQAITSLIKELVAGAKPARAIISDDEIGIDRARKSASNSAIDVYEQNLLKALEDKK